MKDLSPYILRQTASLPGEEVRGLTEPLVEEEGIHLQDYWRIIRKRLWLILTLLGGTVLTTAIIIFTTTPIYTAEATLLIERQVPQALDIRDVLSQPQGPDEYDYYRTQYEILKSQGLAVRVILDQSLEENDYLLKRRTEGFITKLWAPVKVWAEQTLPDKVKQIFPAQAEVLKANYPLGVNPQILEDYQKSLLIDPISRTRLVKVTFSTPNAELSARVANAHAEVYIRQGMELRSRATEEAQKFLEGKLISLKERIGQSEATLNRYRQGKGIISLDEKENFVVARLAQLNQILTEAEAERIALEAQVRITLKRDYDSLPTVINSTLIQTLKGQLTSLEGEYASLSAQFKPGFPRLDQQKAQVEDTRKRLNQEIQNAVKGVQLAYLATQAKEQELREKMEEQKAAALSLKNASVEYAILSREVDTNRQLYDSVLQRMREIGVATGFRSSNVSVIDKASPPLKPSKPKKLLALLLSGLLGLMGGLGLTFVLEYLDDTVKTPAEVARYLRLPNLAMIPDFLSLNEQEPDPRGLPFTVPLLPKAKDFTKGLGMFHQPFSITLEAYRRLRTAILLSRASEPPKTILFTSGAQEEGKTVTVLNTACLFSQMGKRVLVVDADLRHPRCHKLLGTANGFGLTELLTGQRDLHEVIQPTAMVQLFFLASGSIPPNPAELLGSKSMQEILAVLQKHYDYILIDSPPVMPVTDAVLLSTMVDGVVLVINSQKTPRQVIKEAHASLAYARAKILGVVLNKVNMQHSNYARYYSHYGSRVLTPEDEEVS